MSILTYALQVFRYFNTNNVPSSGNHEPVKSEIQALFGLIDSSYNDLAIAITAAGENVIVVPVLNNVSDLSLSYPAGTLAFAMSGNAAGIYLKSGGSGSGSWTLTNLSLTSQLVAALQSAIGAEEAARIAADNALRDAIDAERSDRIQAVSAEEQSRKDADTDIIIQSPNEEHAGDAPLYFTNNLTGGDPADVARNLPGPVVSNADGYSVRITGAGTLSVRTLYPVEAGRTYVVRYAVRRIANSPDPANDSVRCALAWYNQDRSAIGGTPISVVQDLNDLTTGSGRVVVTAYVSRAAGDEIDVVAPANTRYVRPFVQTFGTTCQTDIEVISWSDVTDAAIYSPDVSDLVSRVGALESIDAGPRLDVIEAELNSPGVLGFRTVFDVAAYDVPVSVTAIVVSGYYTPGDGGSAFYKRSSGEPSHGGKVQSFDGTWWEITGTELDVRAFGAKGDNNNDDAPAIGDCLAYLHDIGGGVAIFPSLTFKCNSGLRCGSNTTLRGYKGATLIRNHTFSILINGLGYTTSTPVPAYGGHSNIVVEGLILDLNSVAIPDAGSHFGMGMGSNITVRNCKFLDQYGNHYIDMAACQDVLIEDCEFLGYDLTSKNPDTAEGIQFDAHIEGSFPYFGLPTFALNKRVTVRRCKFGVNPDNADPNYGAPPIGIGSHASVYDFWQEDIVIEDCDFNDHSFAAIRPLKWGGARIRNCRVNGSQYGVYISGAAAGTESSKDIDRNQTNKGQGCVDLVFEDLHVSDMVSIDASPRPVFVVGFSVGDATGEVHKGIKFIRGNLEALTATGYGIELRQTDDFYASALSIKGGINSIFFSTSASNRANITDQCIFSDTSSHAISIGAGSTNTVLDGFRVKNSGARGVHITGASNGGRVTGGTFEDVQGIAVNIQSDSSDWLVNGNTFISTNLTTDTDATPIRSSSTCANVTAINNYNLPSNTGATLPVAMYASSGRAVFDYAGSPASVVTAPVGSTCHNLSGGSGTTLYVKESGGGAATGWVAK